MKIINQDNTEYWDKIYLNPYQDRITNDRNLLKKFIDMVITEKEKLEVLEIGGGIGDIADHVRQKGHNVLCTDYSKQAVKQMKERYPLLQTQRLDILNMEGLEGHKYDIIIAFEILEHIRPMKLRRVIFNLKKLLKRDGRLIFSVPDHRGKYAFYPEHYTIWSYESLNDLFFTFFNSVECILPHRMMLKTNICGICKNK
jgi:2-polyprenyl-3-methyl-5-hydroxy-6-metoxy-1,4-benzoquinol methylase